jgi:hypothetical protein
LKHLRYWFGIIGVVVYGSMAGTSVAQVATTANEEYGTHALREQAASETRTGMPQRPSESNPLPAFQRRIIASRSMCAG